MSIKSNILEYLKSGHTLTALEALKIFGTMNLRNRISELRAEGHNIADRTIHDEKTGKHYSQYWYSEEPRRTEQEEAVANNFQVQEEKINLKAVGQQLEMCI